FEIVFWKSEQVLVLQRSRAVSTCGGPAVLVILSGHHSMSYVLSKRLSKLEMLKRRGKGPPKKGHGKRASKKNK
nr:28S ribosomal protein S33, mitochondrial [Tanacetum cinerariifolium]